MKELMAHKPYSMEYKASARAMTEQEINDLKLWRYKMILELNSKLK